MKKVLLILMMAFTFMANATNPEPPIQTHWTYNPYTTYNMSMTGVLYLDGESMQNSPRSQYLEVGAFCGDECRGSFLATNYSLPFFQGYAYLIQIYSNQPGGEAITFRIWDHEAGEELDVTCTSNVTFTSNESYGNLMSPFELTFIPGGGTPTPPEPPTQTHWTFNPYTQYSMTVTSVVYIDGESMQSSPRSEYLEVGAFCGDECRGSYMATDYNLSSFEGYAYSMVIYSDVSSGETITFRIWDHEAGEELDVTCSSDITFELDASIGDLTNPYELTFTTNGTPTPPEPPTQTHWGYNPYTQYNLTLTGVMYIDGESMQNNPQSEYLEVGAFCGNECRGSYMAANLNLPFFQGYVYQMQIYSNVQSGEQITFKIWDHQNDEELELNSTSPITFVADAGFGNLMNPYQLTFQTSYDITVSANPEEGGTVSGGGSYYPDEVCTLIATPNATYDFVNWTMNGIVASSNANYSFTVNESAAYVANFTLKTYNITVSANPTQGGTVSGGGTYTHGQTCSLTAIANEGYYFVNWTKNGSEVSTDATYSFTVTENAVYEANFALAYHWNVDYSQFANNMIVMAIIQINGVEQATNTLELGAFCGEECRGREKLEYVPVIDRYLLFLLLYGEAGDVNTFRLYDHAVGEESDKVCLETITFIPDGFIGGLEDPFVFNFGYLQTSNFLQGYNWWSTYLEQENMDGLAMLQTGLGDNGISIRSQSNGYNDYYVGYGWYGSLASINNESSYRIITNASCVVNMVGEIADPADYPITLGHGWNWIGYVPSYPLDVTTAFSGFQASAGDKLKSQQGYADYYPGYGWYGSLATITPSMGVMYYSSGSQSITFTYPTEAKSVDLKTNLTPENNHWVPNTYAYPDNMTIMALVELDGVEISSDNYELAVFANGECRGSVKLVYAEPLHRYVAFLTVAGDEVTNLNFALYNAATDKEYFAAEENLNFSVNTHVGTPDEPFVIRFRGTAGMDEFANSVQVYPNPVSCGERFSIIVNNESKTPILVEIVNTLGMVETVYTSSQQTITAPNAAGVYTLRITMEGKGTTVRKLIVR